MVRAAFSWSGFLACLVFASTSLASADSNMGSWTSITKVHKEYFETQNCVWNFRWKAKLAVEQYDDGAIAKIDQSLKHNSEFCRARSGAESIAFEQPQYPVGLVSYSFDDGSSEKFEVGATPTPEVKYSGKKLIAATALAEFAGRQWQYAWSSFPDLLSAIQNNDFEDLFAYLSNASSREKHIYYDANRNRLWRKMQVDSWEIGPALLALNARRDASEVQDDVVEVLNELIAISKGQNQEGLDAPLATLASAISKMDKLSPENAVLQNQFDAAIQLLAKNGINIVSHLQSSKTYSSKAALVTLRNYAKWRRTKSSPEFLGSETEEVEKRFLDNAISSKPPERAPAYRAARVRFFKDLIKWEKESFGVMRDTMRYVAQQVERGEPLEHNTFLPLLERATKIGGGPWNDETYKNVGKTLTPPESDLGKIVELFFD